MAIAFVQDDVAVESASDSTIVKAFGSNVTAGNLIWVAVTWSDADATPTVTDSLGNTYVEIGTHMHTGSGGGAGMSVFYAKNISGGACTVTANYGGSRSFREMFILEASGCDTTDPFDATNNVLEGTAGGSGEADSGTVLPDQNDSLLVGFISSVSGMGTAAPRAGQGWTELIDTTGGGGGFAQYQVKLQTTATTEASLWTVSPTGAGLYNARVAAFRPAGGAQTIAVGQATETDTAQAIAWAPKNRLVNRVTETDAAQPITSRKIRSIGQASETDAAQPIAWAPKHRLVGQATETDTAQAITVFGAAAAAVDHVIIFLRRRRG